LGALKIGMDILKKQEQVQLDKILGHGGFFKTKEVGQKVMAAALDTPVSVMETASEGGAWGIALLAAYMISQEPGQTLGEYLKQQVFADQEEVCVNLNPEDAAGFAAFAERYAEGLPIERAALNYLK